MASKTAKCCQLLFAIFFIGGGGYLIWHFLGRPTSADELQDALNDIDFSDFTDVLDNLTDDAFDDLWKSDADPSVGDNTTYEWDNDGKGLDLELFNALDDNWQEEYEIALNDWENGTPDSLTLSTKRVEVDNACTPVDGVMKVCNGNCKWMVACMDIYKSCFNGRRSRILPNFAKTMERWRQRLAWYQ